MSEVAVSQAERTNRRVEENRGTDCSTPIVLRLCVTLLVIGL